MFYSDVASLMMWVGLLAVGAVCMYRMAVTDWRRRIIPDVYLFPTLITGLIFATFCPWWPTDISSAVIGGTFGYALAAIVGVLFARRHRDDEFPPIGMGDIKLIMTGGLWMGTTGLAWALALTCVAASVWARRNHAKYIPFAPFFIISGILAFIATTFLL